MTASGKRSLLLKCALDSKNAEFQRKVLGFFGREKVATSYSEIERLRMMLRSDPFDEAARKRLEKLQNRSGELALDLRRQIRKVFSPCDDLKVIGFSKIYRHSSRLGRYGITATGTFGGRIKFSGEFSLYYPVANFGDLDTGFTEWTCRVHANAISQGRFGADTKAIWSGPMGDAFRNEGWATLPGGWAFIKGTRGSNRQLSMTLNRLWIQLRKLRKVYEEDFGPHIFSMYDPTVIEGPA